MKKFVLILLWIAFGSGSLYAEIPKVSVSDAKTPPPNYWTGPSSVTTGSTTTYTFDNGNVYPGVTWYINRGMPVSYSESGTTYTITVEWHQAGSGYVMIAYDTDIMILGGTKNVSVTGSTYVPVPNATFNTPTYTCGTTVSTRTGSPPAQYVWYWQTASNGTSMSNSTTTYTQTTSGNLYLRAVTANSPYVWSAAQMVGNRTVYSTAPSTPATATDGHLISPASSAAVAVSVSTTSGTTGYAWYTVATGGSIISGSPTTVSWSPTISTGSATYYVEAVNGPCKSASRKPVVANLYPVPQLTTTEGSVNMGSEAVWSVTNFAYTNYQWINAATNTDINGKTASSFSTTTAGSYKVRVTKSTATYTSDPITVGTGFSGLNMNYVITNEIKKANVLQSTEVDTLSIKSKSQVIEYVDGFGRPLQTVTTQGSPLKRDIAQPFVYDAFGREHRQYKPVVPNSKSGWYKPDIIDVNGNYVGVAGNVYANNPNGKIAQDSRPYAETVFETSPQNRKQKQYAVGSAWSVQGDNKYIETADLVNAHTLNPDAQKEKVVAWTVNLSGMPVRQTSLAGYVESGGFYASNQLLVKQTKDENGYSVREYVTKDKQTILKKAQVKPSANLNNTNDWALTYSIYDERGNLTFVLQPELCKIVHNDDSYILTQAELNAFAFQYSYDGRNRLIRKKMPGADWIDMIYDERDRLVLMQDGNQRQKKQWSFTKYDTLNRPVITGIYTHPTSVTATAMAALIETNDFCETYTGTGSTGYTNHVFPTSNLKIHTIYFFDSYAFVGDMAGSEFDFRNNHLSGQQSSRNLRVNGRLLGTRANVLDTEESLWSVRYFDEKYRAIQAIEQNRLDSLNYETTLFDFTSKITKVKTSYNTSNQSIDITKSYTYDHTGRLIDTYHKINDGNNILLSRNEYNELGQRVTKKLHSEDEGNTFKQHVDYRFNIRGWVSRINKADLIADNVSDPQDYFGMELRYNESSIGGSFPQYNGNISSIKWSGDVRGQISLYNHSYDGLSRLNKSQYKASTDGTNWSLNAEKFSTTSSYDMNGNMLEIVRKNGESRLLDDLTYHYNGNMLEYVDDDGNKNYGFLEGNYYDDDFSYDENGNAEVDRNKYIASMTYNNFNIVSSVVGNEGDSVKYVYTSKGDKIGVEHYDKSGTLESRLDFLGPTLLMDGTFSSVTNDEGQVEIGEGDAEYQYNLADNLGNTRVIFTTKLDVDTTHVTFEDNTIDEETVAVQNYSRVGSDLFDHTDAGLAATHSQKLLGGSNSVIGIGKSYEVLPGDSITAWVFAKYFNPTNPSSNGFVNVGAALINALDLPVNVTAEPGFTNTISAFFAAGPAILGSGEYQWENEDAPKAYINIIIFNKNYEIVDFGFDQIDEGYDQPLGDPTKHPHDLLELKYKVQEPGYVFVYVSNENPELVEVYFDDLTIRHRHSDVIQRNDFYPFGLSIAETSYQKRNPFYKGSSYSNLFGYNDLGFRRYDPGSGRFFNVDPLAELQLEESPYQFAKNNPVKNIDSWGLVPAEYRTDDRMADFKDIAFKDATSSLRNSFKAKMEASNAIGGNGQLKQRLKNFFTRLKNFFTGKSNSGGKYNLQAGSAIPKKGSSKSNTTENTNSEGERQRPNFAYICGVPSGNESNEDNGFYEQNSQRDEDLKNAPAKSRSKTETEKITERSQDKGNSADATFNDVTKSGGSVLAEQTKKLKEGNGKVHPDQKGMPQSPDDPEAILRLLDDIKEATENNSTSLNVTEDFKAMEEDKIYPISMGYYHGRLQLDGKPVEVEVQIHGNYSDQSTQTIIDPNPSKNESSNAFYRTGRFGRYDFDHMPGSNTLGITILVPLEQTRDFEKYMNINSTDDLLLDDILPPNTTPVQRAQYKEFLDAAHSEEGKGSDMTQEDFQTDQIWKYNGNWYSGDKQVVNSKGKKVKVSTEDVGVKKQCWGATKDMIENAGYQSGSSAKVYQVSMEDAATKSKLIYDPDQMAKGLKSILDHLKAGRPVQVGVNYKFGKDKDNVGNLNGTTDHYIVITKAGYDEDGNLYFEFYDPGTSNTDKGTNENNRLYLIKNEDGQYVLKGKGVAGKYEVTEIRPNGDFPADDTKNLNNPLEGPCQTIKCF